ncbi:putative lactam utilization protein B-like protein [Opitutaceae bacterium TAV1]|nr:putative lactam utilization protein B-like protein [Opitutaceae bacterium TAV1]
MSLNLRVDLNADLGEGSPADEALLERVTSASIACGGHAGDAATMLRTVRAAKACGVRVGAHPGYEDREHFGRRARHLPPGEVRALVARQVGALAAICDSEGVSLAHVKPHGALYNQAAADAGIAAEVIAGVMDSPLPGDGREPVGRKRPVLIFAPPSSALARLAEEHGLPVCAEVFADRRYRADGSLASRDQPGALIESPADMCAQVLGILRERRVRTLEGSWLALHGDTVCLHGDGPHALAFARTLRRALQKEGVTIAAP